MLKFWWKKFHCLKLPTIDPWSGQFRPKSQYYRKNIRNRKATKFCWNFVQTRNRRRGGGILSKSEAEFSTWGQIFTRQTFWHLIRGMIKRLQKLKYSIKRIRIFSWNFEFFKKFSDLDQVINLGPSKKIDKIKSKNKMC